jgi:hypothetical protein
MNSQNEGWALTTIDDESPEETSIHMAVALILLLVGG